jgi:predicted Rossmann-fold nucleotide-binding protein
MSYSIASFEHVIKIGTDRVRSIPCMVRVYDKSILPINTIKVGFYGGAGEPDLDGLNNKGVTQASLDAAVKLGHHTSKYGFSGKRIIQEITGAPPGNIAVLTKTAYEDGSRPIGISPHYDEEQHIKNGSPIEGYSIIIFLGTTKEAGLNNAREIRRMNREFAERNGFNVAGSHYIVLLGGSDGSDHERSTAKQRGIDIGLVTSTGGVATESVSYMERIGKKTGSFIVANDDPLYVFNTLLQVEIDSLHGKNPPRLFIDGIIEAANKVKRKL